MADWHRALQLPDILLKILEYLADDPVSLRSAVLVNKTWAEEGTNVLWRNPPVAALASISDGRRQIYAEKVYDLSFSGDEEGFQHAAFRQLRFPRLKRLSVDFYRAQDQEKLWIGQYLQPSLEEFSLYGGDLAEDLLDFLGSRCVRLRKILIDHPINELEPDQFLAFLKAARSLVSMTFLVRMDKLITDQVFLHLAGRDNLEVLKLGKLIGGPIIKEVLEEISDPFKHLQELAIRLESTAVSSLVLTVRSITRLALEMEDDKCEVLQTIVSLRNLRSLEVHFRHKRVLPPAEIMALQHLKQLRKLVLQPWDEESPASTLTDEDFARLSSSLRDLTHLSFQVQCNLSGAALKSLGEHCTLLESCEMLGSYDLRLLNEARVPTFPELRELELGKVEVDEIDEER